MAILALVVFFFFLFVSTSGQDTTTSSSGETVWAAVVFLVAGEHTPTLGPWSASPSILTPSGAQQMLRQGEVFRTRHVLNQDDSPSPDVDVGLSAVPRAHIQDISRDALDNSQLSILAGNDEHLVAGALAFMQGLYPPAVAVFPSSAGNDTISLDAVSGSAVEYPLGGYQYPAIRAVGVLDEESIYVQGHVGCTSWQNLTDVYTKPANMRTNATLAPEFSQLLLAHDVLADIITPPEAATFWSAYDVWTTVDYLYRHNQTVHDGLPEWSTGLRERFKGYALLEQLARNSDGDVSNGDVVMGERERERVIPGRTLAKQILTALRTRIAENEEGGAAPLMTLMFGSIEPLMAFAALSNMTSAVNGSLSSQQTLPEAGSSLVFELFSTATTTTTTTTTMPNMDGLFVRTFFRPGTNTTTSSSSDQQFNPQRLFNTNATMPFIEFSQRMTAIGYDVWAWCDACSANTPFCRSSRDANPGILTSGRHHRENAGSFASVGAVAAGVIGAVVALGVVGLGAGAAVVFGGFRVSHQGRGKGNNSSNNSNNNNGMVHSGGSWFRSKEKEKKRFPDDEDVVVSQRGIQRERAGSWELGGGGVVTVPSLSVPSSAVASPSPGIGHETGVRPISGIRVLDKENEEEGAKKKGDLWFKGEDDDDDRDDAVLRELGMRPTTPRNVV